MIVVSVVWPYCRMRRVALYRCYRRHDWPYHCTRRGTAESSPGCLIVHGTAPSSVLAGNRRLAVSLLEYRSPLGRIAVGLCPAAQRSRFAQYPAPRQTVSSKYDPAPRSAVSLLEHDARRPAVCLLLYPTPTERRALVGTSSPTRCPPCLMYCRQIPLYQRGRHCR